MERVAIRPGSYERTDSIRPACGNSTNRWTIAPVRRLVRCSVLSHCLARYRPSARRVAPLLPEGRRRTGNNRTDSSHTGNKMAIHRGPGRRPARRRSHARSRRRDNRLTNSHLGPPFLSSDYYEQSRGCNGCRPGARGHFPKRNGQKSASAKMGKTRGPRRPGRTPFAVALKCA